MFSISICQITCLNQTNEAFFYVTVLKQFIPNIIYGLSAEVWHLNNYFSAFFNYVSDVFCLIALP